MRAVHWGVLVFGVGASLVTLALHPGVQRVRLPVHAEPITFFHEGQQALQIGMLPTGVKGLDAASCAKCHAGEHADWAGSPHSHASTEPVFAAAFKSEPRALCRSCHSPLDAQQPVLVQQRQDSPSVLLLGETFRTPALGKGGPQAIIEPNPRFDAKLSTEGVNCVTCHVREGTVLTANATALPAPHPLSYSPMMREAKYCAGCHQFEVKVPNAHPFETAGSKAPPSGGMVAPGVRLLSTNGVSDATQVSHGIVQREGANLSHLPIFRQDETPQDPEQPPVPSDPTLEMQYQQEPRVQDTLQEFHASPAAAKGETCQSCHMPPGKEGRRHLFAGSDSLEMLRKAVSLTARLDRATYAPGELLRANITLRNDAGHRFPTGDSVHAGILDVWLRDGKRNLGRQVFVMSNQRSLGERIMALSQKSLPGFSMQITRGATLRTPRGEDTRLIAGKKTELVFQQRLTAALRQAKNPELVVRVYHADVHPGFRGSRIDPGKNTLKLIREERSPVRLEPVAQTKTLRKTEQPA